MDSKVALQPGLQRSIDHRRGVVRIPDLLITRAVHDIGSRRVCRIPGQFHEIDVGGVRVGVVARIGLEGGALPKPAPGVSRVSLGGAVTWAS